MASLIGDAQPWNGMKRCVVASNHEVVGYLDAENSNLWEDGTEVNWTDVENNGHNVMVEIPKFYYTKNVEGDDVYFGVADKIPTGTAVPESEWGVHPAFFRDRTKHLDDSSANPIEVDYRYIGAFHGWRDSQGRLRSLPNKIPTVSRNIGQFRDDAKANGVGWSQWDYYLLYAIQMLYITEYAHPDSQTTVGRGYVDGNSGAIQTGGTLQYGNNTFGETTGKKQMTYRGIEDFFGNVMNFIDGVYSNASRQVQVSVKGYNDTGAGYDTIGQSYSSNITGYITDIQDHKETGFIIAKGGGTDSKGLYDNGYLHSARLASFGANWSNGSYAGAFRFYLSRAPSHSGSYSSARSAL